MDHQPITQEKYNELREEIRRLEEDEMPKIAEKIAEARAEGDLKENAEYHGQREAQGLLKAKINEMQTKLAGSFIVDLATLPKDEVTYWSRVTVKDLADDMEEIYELVGIGEEDYSGEIMKILVTSPMAQAMMGKKIGDKCEVEIPKGTLHLEVVNIEQPQMNAEKK